MFVQDKGELALRIVTQLASVIAIREPHLGADLRRVAEAHANAAVDPGEKAMLEAVRDIIVGATDANRR